MTLQDTCELYKEEGKLENMFSLVLKGKLKKLDAVEESGLTEAEFNQALDEYRKSIATQ